MFYFKKKFQKTKVLNSPYKR